MKKRIISAIVALLIFIPLLIIGKILSLLIDKLPCFSAM